MADKDSHITLKWQETAPELHGAEAAAAITEAFLRLVSQREAEMAAANPDLFKHRPEVIREAARQVPAPSWNPLVESEADYRLRYEAYIVAVKKIVQEAAAPDAGPSSTRAPAPAAAPVCDRSGKRKKFLS